MYIKIYVHIYINRQTDFLSRKSLGTVTTAMMANNCYMPDHMLFAILTLFHLVLSKTL